VDLSDLSALIYDYGKTPPVLSSAVVTGASRFATVPEPSTFVLLASGLIGLLAYAWQRRTA